MRDLKQEILKLGRVTQFQSCNVLGHTHWSRSQREYNSIRNYSLGSWWWFNASKMGKRAWRKMRLNFDSHCDGKLIGRTSSCWASFCSCR